MARTVHHVIQLVDFVMHLIAELSIFTRILGVRRLSDNHLTHFVDKHSLSTIQQAYQRCSQ